MTESTTPLAAAAVIITLPPAAIREPLFSAVMVRELVPEPTARLSSPSP